MKIVDYNKDMDKKVLAEEAYVVCQRANFPVEYQDVYEHLFGNDDAILKILLDSHNQLAGFGVFEKYKLELDRRMATLLYLSGMVIDKKYQGHNVSHEILKITYNQVKSDLVSLRTQNIKMAKALLGMERECLFQMPVKSRDNDGYMIDALKQVEYFKTMDERGVIPNCYGNQLYENLGAIDENFGIQLGECDALAVVVEPKIENKELSLLKK